jgi:hypothetical protein
MGNLLPGTRSTADQVPLYLEDYVGYINIIFLSCMYTTNDFLDCSVLCMGVSQDVNH